MLIAKMHVILKVKLFCFCVLGFFFSVEALFLLRVLIRWELVCCGSYWKYTNQYNCSKVTQIDVLPVHAPLNP